jgi:hypothetical protein
VIASGGEVDDLPLAPDVPRQVPSGKPLLDDYAEQPFVEPPSEVQLIRTPTSIKPGFADQEEHGLTPSSGLVECTLPTLSRGDAAFGVKVEEQVAPALSNEPIAQRNGWSAVHRRV